MISTQFPWLTAITLLPAVAALPIPFIPDKQGKTMRWYALSAALIEFALIVYAFWTQYDPHEPGFQMRETIAWVPQIGLNWSLAVDGLAMPLVVLAGLITTLSIFAAWQVKQRPRLFYALMLLMYSAQIGVFCSQDLLLFFFMWELELVPVYILISIWGGPKRLYAATKFILYTAAGSILILVSGLAMAFYGGDVTFDMQALGLKNYSLEFELFVYASLLIAYGVKLPIFPLHTWLPDAHGEASAPVSMILAGVLLKLGGYALIRMNLQMLPDAHLYFGPVLAILGIVNIVYGALVSFGQQNLKRRLAYSSISHMGFVLLGIASYTEVGLSGAMLQMISHGFVSGAMFLCIGVLYDRMHTRQIADYGGVVNRMPTFAALFLLFAMANAGLPATSGFVGEFMVILGAVQVNFWYAFAAATTLILGAAYTLWMYKRVVFGDVANHHVEELQDIDRREFAMLATLAVCVLAMGIWPAPVTDVMHASVDNLLHHVAQSKL